MHQGLPDQFNKLYFSGDPQKILINMEQPEQGEEPKEEAEEGEAKPSLLDYDQQEEEKKKAPKKNFLEVHRLTVVVRAIENDSQIVPKGLYKINTKHELAYT